MSGVLPVAAPAVFVASAPRDVAPAVADRSDLRPYVLLELKAPRRAAAGSPVVPRPERRG